MPTCDFGETITVEPAHTAVLLYALTGVRIPAGTPLARSLREIERAIRAHPDDAEAWTLPAEPVWSVFHYAHLLQFQGLDERDQAVRAHPAVTTARHLRYRFRTRAPRTDAALRTLAAAVRATHAVDSD
ncbi:hypothetical protein [Nocardiopsis sp. MG754419]|uniref:hypothetical protein n=1 Tax=Nocardiopsis sp. MG754419 TaxID=2259865 RepID=UPI001BA584A4|nr:hypothetical protein [Nocardiopsis sp. MG754419]MBR8743947.1 hypothetical protein [Nocardiopsis sp. MG754419]